MTTDLKDLFDQAGRTPPAPTLDTHAVLRRARRSRNRRIAGALAMTVVVTLALGVGLASRLGRSAAPLPASTPSPTATGGLVALATNPFLTGQDWGFVRIDGEPGALSECILSPQTWGAAEVRRVRLVRNDQSVLPGGQTQAVYNEFVLRFNGVAEAHGAVMEVWRQFADCPLPPGVGTDPKEPPKPSTLFLIDEMFRNQRGGFASVDGQPVTMYALRVARYRNVVVVVEDTGDPDDRAEALMQLALARAVQSP